ncbi:ribonuclease P protein component [Patescibacteria group bacterium]|nr:ribonuclease P protein component [Patescibacteria group bacterium]
MLKKQNRLSSKFEFNITKKYGQKLSCGSLYMFYLKPRNYIGPTKIGFVVTTRMDKRATKRNRLKRIFREIFRQNFDKIANGLWIAVYPTSTSMDKTYEEISTDTNKLLQKIFVA